MWCYCCVGCGITSLCCMLCWLYIDKGISKFNTNHCDFFVWSKVDTITVSVVKDEEFCQKLKKKLEAVFTNVILPELMTQALDPHNDKADKLYCYCERPTFPPMIPCEGHNCKIEWFHYSCVNLTRKPPKTKSWFCPECTINKSVV